VPADLVEDGVHLDISRLVDAAGLAWIAGAEIAAADAPRRVGVGCAGTLGPPLRRYLPALPSGVTLSRAETLWTRIARRSSGVPNSGSGIATTRSRSLLKSQAL
jgi:hypothetical protein